jgi:hypothetical protein
MIPLETKLKDPYYKMMYDKSKETYDLIKPHIFKDEEAIKYILIVKLNALLENQAKEEKKYKGLLTYYKYSLAEYILENDLKKEDKRLYSNLLKDIKENFSNELLNMVVFYYETMEQIESDEYIKLLTKAFYLVDKYKDSPFKTEVLKYLNTINHYEDYKPKEKYVPKDLSMETIASKEDFDKLKENIFYLEMQNSYLSIMRIFREYLQGQEFSKEYIKNRVETYLVDYFYLYSYGAMIIRRNSLGVDELKVTEDKILDPLKSMFMAKVKASKSIDNLRGELKEILEENATKYNINITLNKTEEKIIEDKIAEAKNILGKYNYEYVYHITFNTITYLLAFNEEAKEWLVDNNTDLTLENAKPIKDNDISEELKEIPVKEKKTPKQKKGETSKIKAHKHLENNSDIKEYYKLGNTPTNRAVLDTFGAVTGIETNTLDKINKKLKELENKKKNTKDKKLKEELEAEISLITQKKEAEEKLHKDILDNIDKKSKNIDHLKDILNTKKDQLSKTEKQQYENTINNLYNELEEAKNDLYNYDNRGIVFRGNIFNELEYNDEKGNIIATIRNKNGEPIDPNDAPTLAEAFLRVTNDLFYNKYDMLNKYEEKIDTLFPVEKGGSFRIANETIKRNLGNNGFIIDVKDLLKLLGVSENSFKYYGKQIEKAIRYYNDVEISVQQKDKYTKNEDILNMFFGITSNVYLSRQVNNNQYIYYEISSIYQTILSDNRGNNSNPVIAQNPRELLKYTTGQKGNLRVYKVGETIYTILKESLNGSNGGIKIDSDGYYYKNIGVKTLLRPLKEAKLINRVARPRKYREDIFNPLIMALNTLEEEGLIKYSLIYDDSVYMSNETFKNTFESSQVTITYLKVAEEYDDILAKNLQNKNKTKVNNAKNFVLEWGKYKGKTLKEIYDEDKQYLEWILNEKDLIIKKPKVTRQHIKNLLDSEKELDKLKKS